MIGLPLSRYCFCRGSNWRHTDGPKQYRIRPLIFPHQAKTHRAYSKTLIGRASSAGAPESDPYQVLGVSTKTSSDNIQRAYRHKLQEARSAGDEDLVQVIEQAHSSIMMQQLSQRMKGQVNQDIAYADKAVYFPWKPRVAFADRKLMIITLALHILLWIYAFVAGSSTGTQPAIGSALACAGVTYFKLEKIFPSAGGVAFSMNESDRKQGAKNLIRSMLLAVMGTTAGILLFFTLPDLFSNLILRKTLPFWIYDCQDLILNSGVILMNLLLSLFFR